MVTRDGWRSLREVRPPRSRGGLRVSAVVDGRFAHVAQLVEHTLGKGEVIGSIPIASLGVGHLTRMQI